MKKIVFIIFSLFFIFTNLYASKNLYLSYKEVPKKVFKNQKFKLKIKALITNDNFDNLYTDFSKEKNIQILNPANPWTKIEDNTYENEYFFKIINKDFKLPIFTISLLKNNAIIETQVLLAKEISYSNIATADKRLSNIIAKNLTLKAYKTKQYNNKEALTIIDIDAQNSNLEDFKLQGIKEQGISKFITKEDKENLIYYFVTPVHTKKVVFSYYDLNSKSIKSITIPLVLQNELVSTQTDLNPNDSSFEKYKKIAVFVVFVLFFILFIWKRYKIYLFLSIILFIISVVYFIPNSKGIIKKESYVYILPTKNSTIFFKLDKNQKVEVLNKKNNFIKVIGIEDKFIGWVKEESFEKN